MEGRLQKALRSCAAGLGAVGVRGAAVTVFEAGGRHLLDEGARKVVRGLAETVSHTVLGGLVPPGLGQLAGQSVARLTAATQGVLGQQLAGKLLASRPVAQAVERLGQLSRRAAEQAVEQAAQQVAQPGLRRTAGAMARVVSGSATDQVFVAARRSAGVGALIDGVFSGIEANRAFQRGEISGRQAVVRVSIDAATGALAAGAGVALGAGAVAVLGGLSSPALFVVGATGSLGAKRALRWLFDQEPAAEVAVLAGSDRAS